MHGLEPEGVHGGGVCRLHGLPSAIPFAVADAHPLLVGPFGGRSVPPTGAGLPAPTCVLPGTWRVDGGTLRLAINRARRGWTCAEIQSRKSFGYGRYEFVVNSDLAQLDPWVVLGLFTYACMLLTGPARTTRSTSRSPGGAIAAIRRTPSSSSSHTAGGAITSGSPSRRVLLTPCGGTGRGAESPGESPTGPARS